MPASHGFPTPSNPPASYIPGPAQNFPLQRLKRIEVNRKILGGKPVIRGTRIPVYLVVELLASGMGEEGVLKEYPGLAREDVRAALEYASRVLRQEEVIPIEAS